MGFFDALSKLGKGVVGTALLPVDIAKDAVTLGGAITDEESAIVKRLKKIGRNVGEALDEIDEDD
jgi:hypothetical protein